MDKKLIFAIAVTIVYAIFTFIGVLHHEVWADEAQVWQLCKYMSVPELFHHLHNEGHPAFFYLLVMPFAKIFNNIICMQVICWFAMCLAVFFLMYKSPFKWYLNFAIILSAGFIYFFPVIARSYSILPFLVFAAAYLYTRQKEHPVLYSLTLSAIACTHAIMFCFAFVLFCMFFYDNILKKNESERNLKPFIISSIIMLCSFIYVVWQLHDTTSSNFYIKIATGDFVLRVCKVFLYFFINAYDNLITIDFRLLHPLLDITLILTLFVIYILLFVNLFKNNKKLFCVAFLSIAFQFAIYIAAYAAHTYVTRIFSAHIILLFCFWVLLAEKTFNIKTKLCSEKVTNVLLAIFFIITSYNGFNYYFMDLKRPYAPAVETYNFLKDTLQENDLVFIDNESFNVSLIYYLDKNKMAENVYSVLRGKNVKYVVWDKTLYFMYANEAWKNYIEYILQQNEIKNNIYIIKAYDKLPKDYKRLDELYPDMFELVYNSNPAMVINEKHLVYRYLNKK